ncbi:response regulator [Planctomicrobium sp. SH664]|uniref:response regulator n=1 Tax=Planctomicrobium sp. SH664 TaxID=3448125 RepID=UPI003F5C189C
MSERAAVIRVLCIDDHPLVRKGIASILQHEADMLLVAEGENGEQAVELFRRHQPDVTLMDLRMPGLDGIGATIRIHQEFPEARIIALTSFDGDQDIYRALEAGVRGYLLKETVHAEVLAAIRAVYAGGKRLSQDAAQRLAEYFPQAVLTPREIEVLNCVAQGLSNKDIAARLGTADGTIKIHVQNILAKLNAADRTHAVTTAIKRGIIHL